MAYTPRDWEDYPSEATPLDASALDHMERGIFEAHEQIESQLGGLTLQRVTQAEYDALPTPRDPAVLYIITES